MSVWTANSPGAGRKLNVFLDNGSFQFTDG